MMAVMALALLLAGGWGYYQSSRADKAERRAVLAEELAVRHQQAQAELDAHLRRVEEERENWKLIAEELEKEEGSEEELSPYLRGVLERVR